jgi:hypothetical protein
MEKKPRFCAEATGDDRTSVGGFTVLSDDRESLLDIAIHFWVKRETADWKCSGSIRIRKELC